MVLFYSLALISLFFVFVIRKDFLVFTFLSLFYFLFILIPFFVILINHETTDLALTALEKALIFILCFAATYYFLIFGTFRNTSLYFFHNSKDLRFVIDNAIYLIFIGILMKIIGGDLVHSSIFEIPWKIPMLYGVSDRVYYLGVMLSCISIYRWGFTNKNIIAITIVLSLGVFGGSRVAILIPLAFLILLKASVSGVVKLIFLALTAIFLLIFIIVFVGLYRIDPEDRGFNFDLLLDVFIFRISEFAWPARLIEILNNNELSFNFGWSITSLFGVLPSFFSSYFLGESVFARDTNLMLDIGIANEFMSVPLTPLGEGYYWYGDFGVIIIAFLYSLGFALLLRFTSTLNPITRILLYLQLFRSAFALPVAAFPEFISFLTKDILIDFVVVYLALIFFRILNIKAQKINYLK